MPILIQRNLHDGIHAMTIIDDAERPLRNTRNREQSRVIRLVLSFVTVPVSQCRSGSKITSVQVSTRYCDVIMRNNICGQWLRMSVNHIHIARRTMKDAIVFCDLWRDQLRSADCETRCAPIRCDAFDYSLIYLRSSLFSVSQDNSLAQLIPLISVARVAFSYFKSIEALP